MFNCDSSDKFVYLPSSFNLLILFSFIQIFDLNVNSKEKGRWEKGQNVKYFRIEIHLSFSLGCTQFAFLYDFPHLAQIIYVNYVIHVKTVFFVLLHGYNTRLINTMIPIVYKDVRTYE